MAAAVGEEAVSPCSVLSLLLLIFMLVQMYITYVVSNDEEVDIGSRKEQCELVFLQGDLKMQNIR